MKSCFLGWLVLLAACTSPQKSDEQSLSDTTAVAQTDTVAKAPVENALGERMTLEGDFDGDGQKETLREHYVSRDNGKELSRNYPEVEYDSLVEMVIAQRPKLYLSCSNSAIKELPISEIDQLFGFLQLKNEGDLNGDGTDEISYIVNFADQSTVNHFYIYTFQNQQWKELASFEIREWQLEDDKPLFTKNANGTITAQTFDEEANETEKTIPLKK